MNILHYLLLSSIIYWVISSRIFTYEKVWLTLLDNWLRKLPKFLSISKMLKIKVASSVVLLTRLSKPIIR